ncbi:putative amidohydrolase [Escovopsis weberi]|uniref:Putative amidohydrolase n=1 Tax=Escovopsis weberi TaxID=150374 RepID=A0A0N0RUC7_ESCWE|nr:putative amidohydrolase [Escovopsis weberi]
MTDTRLFVNGRIYQSPAPDGSPAFAQCMIVQDGLIHHIGSEDDEPVLAAKAVNAPTTDLAGRTVLPGFIDGHVHILMLGQSLTKLDLTGCRDIEDIRARIRRFARANPLAKRIFCRGWQSNAMTPGGADASMLDGLDERPVFVDSQDLHSAWCSTAGLAELCREMGIAADAADPPGGMFSRDSGGRLSGVFTESAVFEYVWPFGARVASLDERKHALRQAIRALNAAGCTGVVDMAMDELIWEPLREMRNTEGLGGMRIAAYWLMKPSDSTDRLLKQVDRAAELAAEWNAERALDLRVVGIKIICDGTVDLCTASLREPYSSGGHPGPCWTAEALGMMVSRAHARGLQVALHAIGDRTVGMAIDVLEKSTSASMRPRIEHLELTAEEDAARLGRFGITASVQPVHADPAGLRAWPRLVGPHRCNRAFAYGDFLRGGAVLALGSDAPTAPYPPLPNMYVATTRRSSREPGLDFALDKADSHRISVCEAVAAATEGSAYSTFAEAWSGSLKSGMKADFVVCELDLSAPEELVRGVIQETWFEGRKVYQA